MTAIPSDSVLESCIGPPLQESLARLLSARSAELLNDAIALYRERFSAAGVFENRLYPGITQALEELQESGAMLFVATSKPQTFTERILEHFALRRYFRGVYGSELDGVRSNKGELIAHLLRQEALSPSETAMVGDRAHDVVGARACAVLAIGGLWGVSSLYPSTWISGRT